MTYCVALCVDEGLVFLSDTRTNAGVDNVSAARKMAVFEQPGDRVLTLLCAGNLALTQAVVQRLTEGASPEALQDGERAMRRTGQGKCAGVDGTIGSASDPDGGGHRGGQHHGCLVFPPGDPGDVVDGFVDV